MVVAGHGLTHAALNAANLKNADSVQAKLLRFGKENFYFNSLATAHYPNLEVFCTDVVNAVPGIIMEMLVQSDEGLVEILPALPKGMPKGSISGIKNRNRSTTENLEWDLDEGTALVTLKSDVTQDLELILRAGMADIKIMVGDGASFAGSSLGDIAKVVHLPAGVSVTLFIAIAEEEEPELRDPNQNLALNKQCTADNWSNLDGK